MRLTLKLLFDKLPNGNIFIGKHKLQPKVRHWMKLQLIDDIKREERNMLILRHPYLSKAQTHRYSCDLGKREEFNKKMREIRTSNFPGHIRLEDQLGHLRHHDSWEQYK